VHASPEPGLAESELAQTVAPPASLDEARDTLDERPGVRSARATLVGTHDEASFELMGESLRSANENPAAGTAQPSRRAMPTQLAGSGNPAASAAQVSQRTLTSQLAGNGNPASGAAQVSQRTLTSQLAGNGNPASSAAQVSQRTLTSQLGGSGNPAASAAQVSRRPLDSQLAGTGNPAASAAQVSRRPMAEALDARQPAAQPASRMVPSAHRTQLGPPRPMPPAPPHAASESAESQAQAGGRAANLGSGPAVGGGTLLGGAALAQRHQAEANAAALRRSRRPVPSGRDWRNPSHPPPPTEALDADGALGRAAHADTVALPANDVSARPPSAPGLAADTPRYLDGALAVALQSGASDLHLHSGAQLCMRVEGKLWPLTDGVAITRDVAERVIAEVLDQAQRMQLALEGELRFSYALAGVGRVRAHAYSQERGTDIVFRLSPSPLGSAEKLGLSSMLRSVREQPAGLYVCSGPAGAGKTTTLAALTQALVSERARHVVSVESPIEIVHAAGLGLVEQREVGQHVSSFAQGIELAQRQGADIIVVSDLGADGALEASLRAASARCLVLGGLRASSAVQAISKLLRARDARHAERLRFELSHALQLVTHQRLLPRAKGTGRVLALETLVNTPQVSLLFREDKLHQLPAAMSAGRSHGMLLLDDALEELVRAGTITHEVARRVARRRERFKGA
jgi:twitching motility protein PilT